MYIQRMTNPVDDQREFELLFEKSGLEQKQLAGLLGKTPVQVNRWLTGRKDSGAPPFYAIQFLRIYLMLPASARAHLPSRIITYPKKAA
ncbi:helix-turn-helix domain-containing protein [Mesorhizobium sp. M0204]|uniref:helix-turn-helix domain-containing protein n=1 Tax=Mesorhizobium sp. M0204 TaxID=2956913 RepID=UPI003336323A